jgi:hypothetical protein
MVLMSGCQDSIFSIILNKNKAFVQCDVPNRGHSGAMTYIGGRVLRTAPLIAQ